MDLGGGTGNFTQALAEAAGCSARVLCVDAFAEMLDKASLSACKRMWLETRAGCAFGRVGRRGMLLGYSRRRTH